MIVENLDSQSFKKYKDDKDAVLIDVRTPAENKQKRIPNSLLIDITNPAFAEEIDKLDRSKNYYLYCRSGNRSFHAGNYMLKTRFKNVYHLQPGIIGWDGETEP